MKQIFEIDKTAKQCGVCGLSVLAPKFQPKKDVICKHCDLWVNDVRFRAFELPNIASEALRRLECEIVSHD